MKVMGKFRNEIGESAEEKLKAARAVLYDIVLNYEARPCTIIADGRRAFGRVYYGGSHEYPFDWP
jgi:hypothetical protein